MNLSEQQKLVLNFAYKNANSYANLMGPIIGAHAGPGVVASFFFGKKITFCQLAT